MGRQDAMDFARSAAVMVRVHGPDPKGRKMRRHAFYHSESGDTTLSASGLLLPNCFGGLNNVKSPNKDGQPGLALSSVVITCASIVDPFLSSQENAACPQGTPTLILGAEIDVLTEVAKKSVDEDAEYYRHDSCWLPAQLVALLDVPAAAVALQALLESHGGTAEQGSWEVGWALAPTDGSPQLHRDSSGNRIKGKHILKEGKATEGLLTGSRLSTLNGTSQSELMAMSTTRIAVLSLSATNLKIISQIAVSEPRKRGDFLLVIGSPFGALSPLHFYNSISVGIVANCWPPAATQSSLLMADIRCLPGMEGSPVFSEHAGLVGILTRPLRQRGGGAEVQMVVTWDALAPALDVLQLVLPAKIQMLDRIVHQGSPLFEMTGSQLHVGSYIRQKNELQCIASKLPYACSSTVEQAVASIVLVTVGDGAWASGIVLNEKGLILTNAHLLEPWRFGKTPPLNITEESRSRTFKDFSERSRLVTGANGQGEDRESKSLSSPNYANEQVDNAFSGVRLVSYPTLDLSYRSYRRIRVRLDHVQPRSWCDARVVYVSKGPLDIALLQLVSVPNQLCPIIPEEKSPCPGSRALVIGHGLFGPRSDLCPSVSAGVVARVVKTAKSHGSENLDTDFPAMLETTAAVHPGGSGGVVVNAEGRMIGLVTSNARHSGGTVIPHLNFSIPCAALQSVFKFAAGDLEDLSILSTIDRPNELLSSVWALVPPTPPRPSPSLPFLPDSLQDEKRMQAGVQKGSRFAKFVAEKGAEIALKQYSKQDEQKGLMGPPMKNSRAVDFLQSRL